MAWRPMRAMTTKEFRQLRRDRRTLALLIFQPLVLLVVFGYAASFDVDHVSAAVYGPAAEQVAHALPDALTVQTVSASGDRADAEAALRAREVVVAVLTGSGGADGVLVDGSQLFAARSVVSALAAAGVPAQPQVLYNPGLETPPVLVPALAGLVLAFVGTIATSLGVVRERQTGTMEQLAVMPFRPSDVLIGKLLPYLVVALVDLALVMVASVVVFDVPFNGSLPLFVTGSVLFLTVALGTGLLISTLSENQGQAMQLSMMMTLPQVLLSGAIFPLESMAVVLQWIAYALPLTWFVELARGVMLRAAGWSELAVPLAALAGLAVAVLGLSIARVRRDLLPARAGRTAPDATVAVAGAAR
ncbi:MAG TPA: ABC transporter permease [Nitriliruptorales bacterium]|nr:ABC transporter permease [Nitriliruptorales bacterium]